MKIQHKSILLFLILILGAAACGQIGAAESTHPAAAELKAAPASLQPAPTLRNLAQSRSRWIGVAVSISQIRGIPGYSDLAAREFDMVVPENALKFENVHPEPNRYDFNDADQILAFAQAHQMAMRGHPLVWDSQLPAWVTKGNFSRDQMISLLHDHIQTLVSHYRGQVLAWDVVNEPLDDAGNLRNTIWLQSIGPEYIALAFRWAREADPNVLLFLNEQGAEGLNTKSNAVYALARGLQQAGVPINGIGMQMHVSIGGNFSAPDLKANMKRLADAGLAVEITEMDVRTQYVQASREAKLLWQAQMYRDVMNACLEATNCQALLTWGLSDAVSWIPSYTGRPDFPLLFDTEYKPKPAYYAVQQALSNPPATSAP